MNEEPSKIKGIDVAIMMIIAVLILVVLYIDRTNGNYEIPTATATTHTTITPLTPNLATTSTLFVPIEPPKPNKTRTTLYTTTTTTPGAPTTTQPEITIQCLDKSTLDKLYDLHLTNSESPICQRCYSQCKKDALVTVGLKPPKYNEGPSTNSWTVQGNISRDTIAFKIRSGSDYGLNGLAHNSGFLLNSSMYVWMPVNVSIEHMNYTYTTDNETNTTIRHPNYWYENVTTNDIWVQRR